MKIDQLRADISEVINDKSCSAEFYFLLNENGNISIKQADIDQTAADELSSNLIESICNTILLNDDVSLINISDADDRKDAIYRYDLPEVPSQIKNLAELLQRDNFDSFRFDSDELTHIEGILIILGHGQKQLALYKHQHPIALFKRNSGFNLIPNKKQNRLIKLEDDILRINSKFEFMRIKDEYYIIDIKTLERFFGFHEAIKNLAQRGVENISNANILDNTAPLKDRLDDISFSRKLVRAATASPVLGIVPNTQIISFISTHPALRGKFRLSDDGEKIKLDTKVSQDLFLKLLNDDFLQSELTNQYYASLAKDKLETKINLQ